MGLSIVRATLKEFGGTIALAPARKPAFTVTVPRRKQGHPGAHGSITAGRERGLCPPTHMERTKQKFLKNMVGFSMVTWVSFVLGFLATPYPPGFLSRRAGQGKHVRHICLAVLLHMLFGAGSGVCALFPRAAGRLTRRGCWPSAWPLRWARRFWARLS